MSTVAFKRSKSSFLALLYSLNINFQEVETLKIKKLMER